MMNFIAHLYFKFIIKIKLDMKDKEIYRNIYTEKGNLLVRDII